VTPGPASGLCRRARCRGGFGVHAGGGGAGHPGLRDDRGAAALIWVLEAVTAGTGKGMAIPSLATAGGLRDNLASTGSRCW